MPNCIVFCKGFCGKWLFINSFRKVRMTGDCEHALW